MSGGSRSRQAAGLILLAALAAMLPLFLGPVRTNDSHWINIVWADQFTAALRHGVLWPRWLPESHGGLGAPVFYFYGPMAFWLAGCFGLVGAGAWSSLLLAAAAALAASGYAMYRYLQPRSERPLPAALVYMLAPYHLLDFAQRGALAEFTAYAWLPLVALGIAQAAQRRPVLLTLAYAGLILTHLPTTVLATAFLVPVLAWSEAGGDLRRWLAVGGGLAGGIALAAAYLLPALTLGGATAMETMRGLPIFQPSFWWIGAISPSEAAGVVVIHAIAAASILFAATALWRHPRAPWAWYVIATSLLALGALPPLWRVPVLDQVQFPWRILVLAEFGLALHVAHHPGQRLFVPALAGAPLATLALLVTALPAAPGGVGADTLRRVHPDVIEYLPRGVGEPIGFFSPWALALARTAPPVRVDGAFTTVRRFAFPIWAVRCGGAIVPSGPAPGSGLLRYRGRDCAIERVLPPAERAGGAISLAMLAALLLHMLGGLRFAGLPDRARREACA